jgi:hypothetical protein
VQICAAVAGAADWLRASEQVRAARLRGVIHVRGNGISKVPLFRYGAVEATDCFRTNKQIKRARGGGG